jgi:hypothetical protein
MRKLIALPMLLATTLLLPGYAAAMEGTTSRDTSPQEVTPQDFERSNNQGWVLG